MKEFHIELIIKGSSYLARNIVNAIDEKSARAMKKEVDKALGL